MVILSLTAFVFFFVYQNNFSGKKGENNIEYVKINGQILKLDLAISSEEQAEGLSGRKVLADDAGMLFVFKESSLNFFWMKDMNFPIDIIWLDKNFRIIYFERNVLPSSFPKIFGPKQNSKYVLEVNTGFSEKNNLKEGNLVQFLP